MRYDVDTVLEYGGESVRFSGMLPSNYEEIDLERVTEPRTLTLEDGRGRNTVLVERGRICVSEADCPDQICVKQGWISDGTVPIVCLPHRLVIEITGDGGDVDGAAG